MLRVPAVAGIFYESSSQRLDAQVSAYVEDEGERVQTIGILVPHAGFVYSGGVAGRVYSKIVIPEVILLMGPNHTGLGTGVSVFSEGEWRTPLGDIPIEEPLARAILQRSKRAREDYQAHLQEHSLEVQLPFIQHFRKKFSIVPITIRNTSFETCHDLGSAVSEAIRSYAKPVLMVASSDMSHFEPDDVTRVKDHRALAKVLDLDPEGLHRVIGEEQITMCGFAPTVAMLIAAKAMGAVKAELIDYRTSGEVNGDYEKVVGYAGVIIKN